MKPFDGTSIAAVRPFPPTAMNSKPASSQPRSLLREILYWMLAPLLLVWPMSIAATYLVATAIANVPFDQDLQSSVDLLAKQITLVDGVVQVLWPLSPGDLLRKNDTNHAYFQVVGAKGELISGDRDLGSPHEDEPLTPGIVRFRAGHMRGEAVRIAYTVIDTGAAGRPVLVQVAESLERRAQLANEIIKGVILPQFLILPIAALLVWFGLSRGLRPLSLLQVKIQARQANDMRPIDPRDAPEEIAPLVASFNELLARLGATAEDQRRFIANAAHQMRTPLAGLRTQAELALRENDPKELKRSLQQLATSSVRATRLINQLLSLARAENRPGVGSNHVPTDLGELARDVVRDWVPAALERQIDLGFEASTGAVVVSADPILLRELLKNLLDNAIRYTPTEGSVTVRIAAQSEGRRATLEVEDNGPGIAESERPLVFERFYRILGSSTDGSGLGLAIVREIAEQHGAQVVISDCPSGHAGRPGTSISVSFPSVA